MIVSILSSRSTSIISNSYVSVPTSLLIDQRIDNPLINVLLMRQFGSDISYCTGKT